MKTKIIISIIILSIFLSGSYYDHPIFEEQLDIIQKSDFMDKIPDFAKEILEDAGIENLDYEALSSLSIKEFINILLAGLVSKIKEPFTAFIAITASAIICSVINSLSENFSGTGKAANLIASLTASSVFLIPAKNIIISSVEIIEQCSEFMLAFIPVYSSAIIASGYITTATAFNSLMLGTATVVSRISGEIIAPIISIFLAMSIAGSVSEVNIGEIAKSFKNFAIWILTFSMTVFSGIMGLGTIISSSADNSFSKTAKLIIGSAVPIVGGTVSDAFSTVKSCLNMTKNVLGIYAVAVILAIFLPSIISLFLWKTSLSSASIVGGIFGNKILSDLISSASAVIGIIMALVTVTALMFVISVSIMLLIGGR